jgi:oligo-1,6-glucosidase
MTMYGTPFMYQGEEIGMTNCYLEPEEWKDFEAINDYEMLQSMMHLPAPIAKKVIQKMTRDHARTPMQWSDAPGAGFVGGDGAAEPWYPLNPNYPDINVAQAEEDPQSLLHFYREAIALRRQVPVVREGSYREFKHHSSVLYAYARESASQRMLVVCSFTEKTAYFSSNDDYDIRMGKLCLCNYEDAPTQANAFFLRPYECRVYLWEEETL